MTIAEWKEKANVGNAELSRRLLVEYGVRATDETIRKIISGETRDPGARLCAALIAISDGAIHLEDLVTESPAAVLRKLAEIRGEERR